MLSWSSPHTTKRADRECAGRKVRGGGKPFASRAHAETHVPICRGAPARRTAVRAALERMGLRGFFRAEVTAEDGMETLAQRLLSAAIKLGRPPDHCVVFETSPVGVCAAHNCTMKARAAPAG
jgi:beta-phosphoglucomutase-like phosphatase (HAD superfamily)